MIRLLRANFRRLWKSKLFWFGVLCMTALAVYAIWGTLIGNKENPDYAVQSPEVFLLTSSVFVGIIAAVFSAFYIGTEYSDGAMRNKLIAGHSRVAIYFSNFIVCFAANVIMTLVFMVIIMVAGSILVGPFVVSAGVIVKLSLVSFVPMLAVTSIYTVLEMLIHNKAIAITTLIVLSFGMLMYQTVIKNRLAAKEYNEAYTWTDDEGKVHEEPREKNPYYLTGLKRRYYEVMNDVLPLNQEIQISNMLVGSEETAGELTDENNHTILIFIGYSALIICITSGVGVLVFRKKDIK